MKVVRLTDNEIERNHRLFLQWVAPINEHKALLYQYGFKAWLITPDGVKRILHEVYQKEIDSIDEYIQGKAKELGLTPL